MNMTAAQARLIDPILTTVARGYTRPGNVGQMLFPTVPVQVYGGQVIEFGKEGFRRYNTKRAPGAHVSTIDFGYLGKPYRIVSNALEAVVPHEVWNDANKGPGIDIMGVAVQTVLDALLLGHEYDSAEIARNATNYDDEHKLTLASTTLWSASTGKPTTDVEAASEVVRASTGQRANVVVLSPSAYKACKNNAQIVDRLRYTSSASVTRDMLAKLWEVEQVLVGDAVSASGTDDTFSDIWGDDVIVAYVPNVGAGAGAASRSQGRPSYGYTYAIANEPHVRRPRYEESRLSWLSGVSYDATPVLCGMAAGYLLKNAGS